MNEYFHDSQHRLRVDFLREGAQLKIADGLVRRLLESAARQVSVDSALALLVALPSGE